MMMTIMMRMLTAVMVMAIIMVMVDGHGPVSLVAITPSIGSGHGESSYFIQMSPNVQ